MPQISFVSRERGAQRPVEDDVKGSGLENRAHLEERALGDLDRLRGEAGGHTIPRFVLSSVPR